MKGKEVNGTMGSRYRSVRLTDAEWTALEKQAAKESRSVNNLVTILLREGMAARKEGATGKKKAK